MVFPFREQPRGLMDPNLDSACVRELECSTDVVNVALLGPRSPSHSGVSSCVV